MTSNLVEYVEANWPHESLDALVRVVKAEIEAIEAGVFVKRGIPPEIFRHFPRYEPNDHSAADMAFQGATAAQQAFKNAEIKEVPQGYVLPREPPPGLGLPPILPQLRADDGRTGTAEPTKSGRPHLHYHGTTPLTAGELFRWAVTHDALKKWRKRVERGEEPFDPSGPPPEWVEVFAPDSLKGEAHISAKESPHDLRPEEGYLGSHSGHNCNEPHYHWRKGKYKNAPEPKVHPRHDHDTYCDPDKRWKHVDKWHEGVDLEGEHAHKEWRKVRDPGAWPVAMRISVPLEPFTAEAARRLRAHPVVFMALEGTLKGVAIFASGAAVFIALSVWQWDAPELGDFVEAYGLKDKTVVVTPDSDWAENWMVSSGARACQVRLQQLGVAKAIVAAPPAAPDGRKQGVDDFLGDGGEPGSLLVIDREPPTSALEDFIASKIWGAPHGRGRWQDGARRREQVLRALVGYAAADGRVAGSLHALTRLAGFDRGHSGHAGLMRTHRALQDLVALGALAPLESAGAIFDEDPAPKWVRTKTRCIKKQPEWSFPSDASPERPQDASVDPRRPVAVLVADLRPKDSRRRQLGEVVAEHRGELPWLP
jgi:hypothetical protein